MNTIKPSQDKTVERKGIKISISNRHPVNHYSDDKTGIICSECFHEVQLAHRFCWYCGVQLNKFAASGSWDYISENRKDYQEDEETEWESKED